MKSFGTVPDDGFHKNEGSEDIYMSETKVKFDLRTLLVEALSTEPFPDGQVPECPSKEPLPKGAKVIGTMTDHPELVRLHLLCESLSKQHDSLVSKLGEKQEKEGGISADDKAELLSLLHSHTAAGNAFNVIFGTLYGSGKDIVLYAGWQLVVDEPCGCPLCLLKRAVSGLFCP